MKSLILCLALAVLCSVNVNAQVDSTYIKKFTKAFDLISNYSIKKDSIDWDSMKMKYGSRTDTISSEQVFRDLLDEMITEINDGHSFLYYQGKQTDWGSEGNYPESSLITKMLDEDTAYIRIPSVGAQDSATVQSETKKIRKAVCEVISNEPKFVVVDLTRDFGGNMYPMILGMQPVLGNGTVGYFERDKGDRSAWILKPNELLFDENSIVKVDSLDECAITDEAKLAVLINGYTISSGEALAVALVGAPNSVFIGEPTQGATTANQTFFLDQSNMLFLTVATYMDRNLKRYGAKIYPDITVSCEDCSLEEKDEKLLAAAIKWFSEKH